MVNIFPKQYSVSLFCPMQYMCRIFFYICNVMTRNMRTNYNMLKAFALVLIIIASAGVNPASAKKPKEKDYLRVLYWNIQNGMWAGQEDNYQKFVDWINSKEPDICLFEEGATIYYTGTHDHMPNVICRPIGENSAPGGDTSIISSFPADLRLRLLMGLQTIRVWLPRDSPSTASASSRAANLIR